MALGATFRPAEGSYSVNGAYLEFDIPLLSGKPLARELDVDLATRWSDCSLSGSTDNSRVGLHSRPIDDLLVGSTRVAIR